MRIQRGNLELVVSKYNSILSSILPVEAALLAPQLAVIDAALGRGMTADTGGGLDGGAVGGGSGGNGAPSGGGTGGLGTGGGTSNNGAVGGGARLTWRSLSIDDFVAECVALVDEAYAALLSVQVTCGPFFLIYSTT